MVKIGVSESYLEPIISVILAIPDPKYLMYFNFNFLSSPIGETLIQSIGELRSNSGAAG